MIFGKTQKIMKTGIQILVKANENEGVSYTMCNSWKPQNEVSFKDIMDVRVDLLGFEMMASPFLRKSVDMYAKYYDASSSQINLFIFEKSEKIGVAVYEDTTFKETLTLEKQFERLGI